MSELDTGGEGARVHSTTEDVPCESVPHPGAGGQGGQGEGGEGEGFIHGGDEDLSLVVVGDQNTCSSVISSGEY